MPKVTIIMKVKQTSLNTKWCHWVYPYWPFTLPVILSNKSCPDLNIYKADQLESTFVEMTNPEKSNFLIGWIHRHPNIDVLILKITIWAKFLKLYPKKQKQVFLLGDFNKNLLNYNDHQSTNDLVDSLVSNSLVPYILHPTRITSHSKTLIDNIFSNFISYEIISGNIIATISDYLPDFSLFLILC